MAHHVFVAPDLARIGGRLGPKILRKSDLARIHLIAPGSESVVLNFTREGRLPPAECDLAVVPVVGSALDHLRDHPDDLAYLRDLTGPEGFRHWLDRWTFLAEGGLPAMLGSSLWSGQDQFIDFILTHPWTYALKGRQVGLTTCECAYDAFVWRLGQPNSRTHLFSHREDESQELLEQVVFGLENIPEWLRLPVKRETSKHYEAAAGPGDRRILHAYTAARTTSRGSTCNHAHVDEWAQMSFPSKSMASIEPSCAGSMHILTTEVAPESDTASYYRKCIGGEGKHEPLFVSSLARPDRDEDWYEGQRRAMPESDFNKEYPTTWEQALEAAGERYFRAETIDAANQDTDGFQEWESGHNYGIGVDVGYVRDASVITVVDSTDEIADIVAQVYLRGANPVDVQRAVQKVAEEYRDGHVLIEDNGPGYALRQNVDISERRMEGFSTTALSKAHILGQLQHSLAHQQVKWLHDECPELTREMYQYRGPSDDKNYPQDCVISLALAVEAATRAQHSELGRILAVIEC